MVTSFRCAVLQVPHTGAQTHLHHLGFASKVFFRGCAARCEAWLCLAVAEEKKTGLAPGMGLWPVNAGRSPNQGLSPVST